MASKTKDCDVYLIGPQKPKITGRKLPTTQQVLQLFFYNHKTLNLNLKASAIKTLKNVENFWQRAGIPVCRTQSSVEKLLKLHQKWRNIHRNRSRKNSKVQKTKEHNFETHIENLFDIARHDALEISTPDQRDLLISQRGKNRRGLLQMNSTDPPANPPLAIEEGKVEAAAENESLGSEDPNVLDSQDLSQSFSGLSVHDQGSDSEEENLKRTVSNFEDELEQPAPKKVKRTEVITPRVVAALDRTGLTSRKSLFVLGAFAEALGHNVDELNLSYSTIERRRKKYREQIANDLKADLQVARVPVLHWDGKLLPEDNNNNSRKSERLPIVLTEYGTITWRTKVEFRNRGKCS